MRNILVLSDNAQEILSVFRSVKGKSDKKEFKQKTFTVNTDPVNPLQYDIAFLDLDMAEWQKRLLELRHRMPVIAFSGDNVHEAVEAMKLGASDFIEKPLTPAQGQRQLMATVSLTHEGTAWTLRREKDVAPFASADPDTSRIWWTDAGVHQNLSFPVQPDPVSGMHCWHQAVRVRKAEAGDRYGDVSVDTAKAREAYAEWLSRTRPALLHSPDGTRRPYWLLRPLKPGREAYRLPPGKGTPGEPTS